MESKQPLKTPQTSKSSAQANAMGELSSRLSDIELKLDHIIERIRDSLHRMNPEKQDDWEEKP